MMHNTICHCLLTDTQPVPEQWSAPPANFLQFICWVWCFLASSGQLSWPCSLWHLMHLHTLRASETEKSLTLSEHYWATTKILVCHQHVVCQVFHQGGLMKGIIYFVSYSYLLYRLSITKNIIPVAWTKLSSKHFTKEVCLIVLFYKYGMYYL